jgi:hypothetical protein
VQALKSAEAAKIAAGEAREEEVEKENEVEEKAQAQPSPEAVKKSEDEARKGEGAVGVAPEEEEAEEEAALEGGSVKAEAAALDKGGNAILGGKASEFESGRGMDTGSQNRGMGEGAGPTDTTTAATTAAEPQALFRSGTKVAVYKAAEAIVLEASGGGSASDGMAVVAAQALESAEAAKIAGEAREEEVEKEI